MFIVRFVIINNKFDCFYDIVDMPWLDYTNRPLTTTTTATTSTTTTTPIATTITMYRTMQQPETNISQLSFTASSIPPPTNNPSTTTSTTTNIAAVGPC